MPKPHKPDEISYRNLMLLASVMLLMLTWGIVFIITGTLYLWMKVASMVVIGLLTAFGAWLDKHKQAQDEQEADKGKQDKVKGKSEAGRQKPQT
jgi:hypothetical protein